MSAKRPSLPSTAIYATGESKKKIKKVFKMRSVRKGLLSRPRLSTQQVNIIKIKIK